MQETLFTLDGYTAVFTFIEGHWHLELLNDRGELLAFA